MAEDVRWTFTTVGIPRVASTEPTDGSQRADRFGLRINFTNPMDQRFVEDHIAIQPKPEDDPHLFWEENGRVLLVRPKRLSLKLTRMDGWLPGSVSTASIAAVSTYSNAKFSYPEH